MGSDCLTWEPEKKMDKPKSKSEMRRLAVQRADRCRHFTGIQNKTCKAGIEYASVCDRSVSPYRWPCTKDGLTCSEKSPYSQEELEAQEREHAACFANFVKARAAIVEHGQASGEIPCPCCDGGKLRYVKASINGHIHAACSTDGCVRWME